MLFSQLFCLRLPVRLDKEIEGTYSTSNYCELRHACKGFRPKEKEHKTKKVLQ